MGFRRKEKWFVHTTFECPEIVDIPPNCGKQCPKIICVVEIINLNLQNIPPSCG